MRAATLVTLAFTLALSAAGVAPAAAQTSEHYRLTEFTFNAGGDPQDGTYAASAHHRIRIDALGDTVAQTALASATHRMRGGFVVAYPPPGEVLRLALGADRATLTWTPERSAGTYNVYRGLVSGLPGPFGSCLQARIGAETGTDAGTPPPGNGWFYLVTVRNLLDEEGSKGTQGSGAERPNPAPCP